LGLAHFVIKIAATLLKKETGFTKFVVESQALYILESLRCSWLFSDGEDLDPITLTRGFI
jgi:hypothetical protein